MKCREARDLIMTDYIDGELDVLTERIVKEHIAGCEGCRALEAKVRSSAASFKDVKEIVPPAAVWGRIEREIAPKAGAYGAIERLRQRIEEALFAPRLRLAMETLIVAILVVLFMGYHRFAEERALGAYIEEEMSFMGDLAANGIDADTELFPGSNGLS